MSIFPEDKIRDALLALRWRGEGETPDPGYFAGTASEALRFGNSTASFLAHFIADSVVRNDVEQVDPLEAELDKYSLEVIASYLEAHGYIVTAEG